MPSELEAVPNTVDDMGRCRHRHRYRSGYLWGRGRRQYKMSRCVYTMTLCTLPALFLWLEKMRQKTKQMHILPSRGHLFPTRFPKKNVLLVTELLALVFWRPAAYLYSLFASHWQRVDDNEPQTVQRSFERRCQ